MSSGSAARNRSPGRSGGVAHKVNPAASPWRFVEAAVKAKARRAALEAFADELETERFTAEQIRFPNLIVDELTRNGHMEPGRLFESPYTDTAPTRPIDLFPDPDGT